MSNLIKSNLVHHTYDKLIINSDAKLDRLFPGFTPLGNFSKQVVEGEEDIAITELAVSLEEETESKWEQQAREKAEEIVNNAKKEARRIEIEALQEAEQKKEEIFELTRQNGYKAGYEEGREKIFELEEQLQQEKKEQEEAYQQELSNMEGQLIEVITSLLEKITGVIVKDKKEVILHLIHQALKEAERSKQIRVRISKSDYPFVERRKEELKSLIPATTEFELLEDSNLKQNECMIDLDCKIIDCSLDIQMQNLIDNLKILSIQQ